MNESFNITCSSEANPPAKYRFYKNQDNFVNDTTGSNVSVITTSVSKRRKQVNYSCTAFNDFGDGPTNGLTLTVLCKYAISIAIPCFMFFFMFLRKKLTYICTFVDLLTIKSLTKWSTCLIFVKYMILRVSLMTRKNFTSLNIN